MKISFFEFAGLLKAAAILCNSLKARFALECCFLRKFAFLFKHCRVRDLDHVTTASHAVYNLIMVERIVDQLLGWLSSMLMRLVVRQLTLSTLLLG